MKNWIWKNLRQNTNNRCSVSAFSRWYKYFESIFCHPQISNDRSRSIHMHLFIAVSTNKPGDIFGMADNRVKNFCLLTRLRLMWNGVFFSLSFEFFFNFKCEKQKWAIISASSQMNRQFSTLVLRGSLITLFCNEAKNGQQQNKVH